METYLAKMGRLIKAYESAIRAEVKIQSRVGTLQKAALEASRMRYNAEAAIDLHRSQVSEYERKSGEVDKNE